MYIYKSENLEKKIREIIKNYKKFQIDLRNKKKDNHFSNIETSIDEIFNLINQLKTEKNNQFRKIAYKVKTTKSFVIVILNKLKSFVNK